MAKLMMVNPRKRRTTRRRKAATPVRRRRRTTSRRKSPARRYRRNPIARKTGVMTQVQNAAIGAAGAIGVDFAFAKLPIPANLKTGMLAPATKGAVSLGLGMVVSKVMKNKKLGTQIAEGGITVALHDLMKQQIGGAIGLSGVDDTLLGFDDTLLGMEDLGLDAIYDSGMGNIYDDSMGYAGAAPAFDPDYDF